MRQVVYSERLRRLIYLETKATPEFWDQRWQDVGAPGPVSPREEVVTVTGKFLPHGARMLEGGCGRANKVKAMAVAGYEAVGVDFAEESVRAARRHYPDLDIRQGDVRALEFADGHFDGYWSIGVIEHFWDGYDPILAEAARVLRPGGFLFLTAPWFSPYRQRRVAAGGYPRDDFNAEPATFYQFALGREEVSERLSAHRFSVVQWSGLASEVAMMEDWRTWRAPVEWLFGSGGSIIKRGLRKAVASAMNPFCGHSFLAVARRET